jgi:hypothetical protein
VLGDDAEDWLEGPLNCAPQFHGELAGCLVPVIDVMVHQTTTPHPRHTSSFHVLCRYQC